MPNSRAADTRHSDAGVAAEQANEEAPEGEQATADGAAERERLASELAAMEDRYKRALADLDNYRKRAAREVDRRALEQREALLRDWLEAVDSVERALRMASPENPLSEGLSPVLEQMESILARQGVTRSGNAGEQFDPERHEAVGVVTSAELPDRSIVDVTRSGYQLGDRPLRPAQVIVARRQGNG